MLPSVSTSSPSNWEELMSSCFWWLPNCPALDVGFSLARAATLYKQGMKYYRDIWCGGRFLTSPEVQEKYGLLPTEASAWPEVITRLYNMWGNLIRSSPRKINCGEWLAVYGVAGDPIPIVVCRAEEGFQPAVGTSMVKIPHKIQLFKVKWLSKTLEEISSVSL